MANKRIELLKDGADMVDNDQTSLFVVIKTNRN